MKNEIIDLGYEIQQVEDGRVTFEGDEEAICRANVFLRTTERIMIKVGKFKAYTFDELFENKFKEFFLVGLDTEKYNGLCSLGCSILNIDIDYKNISENFSKM